MVYDIDNLKGGKDFIGQCETSLGKIFGSNRQTFVSDVTVENNKTSRGKIIVRLDNVNSTNDELRMKLSANLVPFAFLCCGGINNPFYVISRARDINNKDEFVRVYQSTHVMNITNPMWNPTKLKLA